MEEATLKIFNVPNLLSISRILAVPIFILLMLEPSPVRALLAGTFLRHRIFNCIGNRLA